uniref:Peptidase M12B domain-containing protein n=1 Tax=Coturnix japonica TaxID=93934 RepID=A0A8C2T4U6_COTJA
MVKKWTERQENHANIEHEQCYPLYNHTLSAPSSLCSSPDHSLHSLMLLLLYLGLQSFRSLSTPCYVTCLISPPLQELPHLDNLPLSVRYLELALITNKELFKANGNNKTQMLNLFLSISNILNTVYKQMKLQVVLSAVEMWTTEDQVVATQSLAQTLRSFSSWCQQDAAGRLPYDHVELLLGEHYEERGFTWKGAMCQPNSIGVVSVRGDLTDHNISPKSHIPIQHFTAHRMINCGIVVVGKDL